MRAMRAARTPAPTVPAGMMVKDAIPDMTVDAGCSVGVVDEGRLVGTLSKNDVLARVLGEGLDAASTPVRDAMTAPPLTIGVEAELEEALKVMTAHGQCFLPVVDDVGAVAGWLTVCHTLQENIERLSDNLDTFAAMLGADGPGG